jgi:hypothetical protein
MNKRFTSLLLVFTIVISLGANVMASNYNDVPDSHWAAEYIELLTQKGILKGTPKGECLPDQNITRAELSALISRNYDQDEYVDMAVNTFSDVLDTHWAKKDIERLVKHSVILPNEYKNGFYPDINASRIEMIRMIVRWLNKDSNVPSKMTPTGFSDDIDLSPEDRGYINVARDIGLISGYPDNSLKPQNPITRAEVFKILCIGLNEKSKPSYFIIFGGNSSGSGSQKTVPKPTVEFALSPYAHTDTEIEVSTKNKNVKSIIWQIRKYDNEQKKYNKVDINNVINGSLNDSGGTIRFNQSGKYEIVAIASNSKGTEYEYKKEINIYDVPTLTLQLNENEYIDNEINIILTNNIDSLNHNIDWYITDETGQKQHYTEFTNGELSKNGGTIKFKTDGKYIISANLTDETNRVFTIEKAITIFPIPIINITANEKVMIDEHVPINIVLNHIGDKEIKWFISKNNDIKPYNEYAKGILSNDGGSIYFENQGQYELIAQVTDELNKQFEYSTSIKVYPIPILNFNLPETAHTDSIINIENNFNNIDGLDVCWKIQKESSEPTDYTEYVSGELSNTGGKIVFKEEGAYTLTANIVNELGKTYSFSDTIIIYPVISPILSVPSVSHIDSTFHISLSDTERQNVEWKISKNNSELQPYNNFTDNILSVNGGNIQLKQDGKYKIVAIITDVTGRQFITESTIIIYPIPTVNFDIPIYAHTDTQIEINPITTNIENNEITWTIIKDDIEKPYNEYVTGELHQNGGTITFLNNGTYSIKATFEDASGRKFESLKTIKIYTIPIVEFGEFGLPNIAHTDTSILIKPELTNIENLKIEWLISKNQTDPLPYNEYVDGSLENTGGTIKFKDKGEYELIAMITDDVGRKYTYNSNTKIYPVPIINLNVPDIGHTDSLININNDNSELNNLDIIWSMTKDGSTEQDYSIFTSGKLNNTGGTISILQKGNYVLIATVIDETGRVFSSSSNLKIYPVPDILIYAPKSAHTDTPINITTKTNELDNLTIKWSIKNNDNNSDIDYFTNNGGTIHLESQGEYIIIATVIDETGRSFKSETQIKIYPIPDLSFDIPLYSHTDTQFSVITHFCDVNNTVSWYVNEENQVLSSNGGTLLLSQKGDYNITSQVTDDTGRTFKYTKSINVYPVPIVNFRRDSNAEFVLPEYGYVNQSITIIPELKELNDLSIKWLISKDGKEAKDYSAYAQGIMTADGGILTFPNTGQYNLIAQISDKVNRVFEYTESIIINSTPSLSFNMPEHSYKEESINITAVGAENNTFEWKISKDNKNPQPYTEYVDGILETNGGSIKFKESGNYNLIFTVTDEAGKVFSFSKRIKILDIPNVEITLPDNTHIGETVKITPKIEHADNLKIQWKLNNKPYQYFANGTLSDNGGSIEFVIPGEYILSATMINEYGREFVYTSNIIKVYDNLYPSFISPLYSSINTDVRITVLEGNNIKWTIQYNNDAEQDYNNVVDGMITDNGGTISFTKAGNYTIIATTTDTIGKEFKYTQNIKIYDIPTVTINCNEKYHANEEINLFTDLTNMEGLEINWTISKDGNVAENYLKYASGVLTKDGGTIFIKEPGEYNIIALVTDKLGISHEFSKTVHIIDVPYIDLNMPQSAFINENINIKVNNYSNDNSINWLIKKGDDTAQDLLTYADGVLNEQGGTIKFKSEGHYTIIAEITDSLNSKHQYSKEIDIFHSSSLKLTTPQYSYINANIKILVEANNLQKTSLKWQISRDNGELENYITYANGTLTDDGGSISFDAPGIYKVVATGYDQLNNIVTSEATINIFELPNIGITMPSTAHTNKAVIVATTNQNTEDATVSWYISKDGDEEQIYTKYVTGELNKNGGYITFNESGSYTVFAKVVDRNGKTFKYHSTITIYDNPEIGIDIVSESYINKSIKILINSSGLKDISWSIAKNGKNAENYLKYATGTLTNIGGSISFDEAGTYKIIASSVDDTGENHIAESIITIYHTPSINIITKDADTIYNDFVVETQLNDVDESRYTYKWFIRYNNGEKINIDKYASTNFNINGGTLSFYESGNYTIYLELTDNLENIFLYEKNIKVDNKSSVNFTLQGTGYIGIENKIISSLNGDNLTIEWSISKNGNTRQPYLYYADGILNNDGGSITFDKVGTYTVYAIIVDKYGNSYITQRLITIEELPTANVIIPPYTHTDTTITAVANSVISQSGIEWYVKDTQTNKTLPYSNYCKGNLSSSGGEIKFINAGFYELIARVKGSDGKTFDYNAPIHVYPTPTLDTNVPTSLHICDSFFLNLTPLNTYPNTSVTWSVKKDGLDVDNWDYISQNSNGSLYFSEFGNYKITVNVKDEVGRIFEFISYILVYNINPDMPTVQINKTRNYKNNKYYVELIPKATDSDGDSVTYEYENKPNDNYYPLGYTYVHVRAKDIHGAYSPWKTVTVYVSNDSPSAPTLTRTPDSASIEPNTPVIIQASGSVDPDGDAIHYVWSGIRSNNIYPLGKNIVTCKAVDNAGAESSSTAMVFFVANETQGGGMELTGPDSTIIEEGIEGATITGYTFTVPQVSGHNSSNDFGRIRGYNIQTKSWEEIDYKSTNNGVVMTQTLEKGKYSKLEFYYYTDHNCMYNHSNITYDVSFDFPSN